MNSLRDLDLTDSSVLFTGTNEIKIPSSEYFSCDRWCCNLYRRCSGAQGNLTDGTTYYLTKSGTANKLSLRPHM